MTVPSLLLLAMGLLGATDIALFHVRAHALRSHRPARAELVTHFLRGPTYAVLFFAVPNLELAGTWFMALLAVLVFDLAISVADFWLEPQSRSQLGGLPRGEYVLHIALAMLFGALLAAVLYEGGGRWHEPSRLSWIPVGAGDVPTVLRAVLTAMAPAVLLTGLLDLLAVVKLGRSTA